MLNCIDRGSGEPVLLLHGIPGSHATWHDAGASLMKDGIRIVVPDLLGFGGSPDGSAAPHALEQAKAIVATLDDLAIDAAHLAGFDFGGPAAVAVWMLAPQRVRSMTLIAANLLTDTPIPFPLRIANVPLLGELAFRLLFSRAGSDVLWRMATVDRDAFPNRAYREYAGARELATTRRIFLRSLRELRTLYTPIENALPTIGVPATVVWAARDPFFAVATGRKIASRIRDSRFIVIDQCGHFVPAERPVQVASAIADTVRRAAEMPQRPAVREETSRCERGGTRC